MGSRLQAMGEAKKEGFCGGGLEGQVAVESPAGMWGSPPSNLKTKTGLPATYSLSTTSSSPISAP